MTDTKIDQLLNAAASTADLSERSRLIGEAARVHDEAQTVSKAPQGANLMTSMARRRR